MDALICLDGCAPEYLEAADTPRLDYVKRHGAYAVARAVIPTVTNVNNVSIVTSAYPAIHGVTSNYFIDRSGGTEYYVESAEFLRAPTIFEALKAVGRRTLLVTAKDKLRNLIGRAASVAFSLEQPLRGIVERIGGPPSIYSADANAWLLRAALEAMKEGHPDFAYISTTDFVPHKFAPEDSTARAMFAAIDRAVGDILEEFPTLRLGITADHGMNAKDRAYDLDRVLDRQGILSLSIPIIRDRYIQHHSNLGGAAYVYLRRRDDGRAAALVLSGLPGVEEVLPQEEAAARYHLLPERIGDMMVLADVRTVFGRLDAPEERVALRSHGSRHEERVPVILSRPLASAPEYAKDVLLSMQVWPGKGYRNADKITG